MNTLLSRPLCPILLILAFLPNSNASSQSDSIRAFHFESGYEECHYGIPFLYLKGTDYEVGLQYGTLLKDELKTVYCEFEDLKHDMMEREVKHLPWYQRIFANLLGGLVFQHKINTYADQLPQDIEEQIRGASEGSGLPASFYREIQVMADLTSRRCEGIVIVHRDHTYHCHNLDQPLPLNLLAKFPVVIHYAIPGKAQYTNLSFAACFMITTAFNENGISFSENGNNNPMPIETDNTDLYIQRNRLITETRNLREVDSLMNTLQLSMPLLFTVASSTERRAVVYDLLGSTKAATPVTTYQFIANKTLSPTLGKKSESVYSGNFHDAARENKFAELIDTNSSDFVGHAISMLSNQAFYHYDDSISVHIESLHNFETDQSVIFDLADSTVYFACNRHYAAWSRWLKYNFATRQVNIYREAEPRLSSPALARVMAMFTEYETCDWRDSSNVRKLMNTILRSGIINYFTLDFLSTTYLNYYHAPGPATVYADLLIGRYPDVITGYYNKGRSLEAENRADEAIGEYTRALKSTIQCDYYLAETDEHLALMYHSIGKDTFAREYAARALDLNKQYWIPEYMNERIQKLEAITDENR